MVPTVDDPQVDESLSIPRDIVGIYRVAHPVDGVISVEPPVEAAPLLWEEGALDIIDAYLWPRVGGKRRGRGDSGRGLEVANLLRRHGLQAIDYSMNSGLSLEPSLSVE